MWTAIAPEAVFTVRTYATRRDHGAGSPIGHRTKCVVMTCLRDHARILS